MCSRLREFRIFVHPNWKLSKTSASRERTGLANERLERFARSLWNSPDFLSRNLCVSVRKSEFKLRNTYLSFSKHFQRETEENNYLLCWSKQRPTIEKRFLENTNFSFLGRSTDRPREQRHYQTVRDSSRGDEAWRIFKIIGWNINEGLRTKGGQFKCYLCTYDIICLLEYWIRKDFSVDVEGYTIVCL